MEIHRQTCQSCGSINMKNILVRCPEESDRVFVQCQDCEQFVARYIIGDRGYYHHGKEFESYLRSLNRGGYFESGKSIHDEFSRMKENVLEQFEVILIQMKSKNKT